MARIRSSSSIHPVWFHGVSLGLALACLPGAALADDAERSPLRAGAWAVQFEVDPTYRYDLGVSSGASLSMKRHRSERTAYRMGVGARFANSEGDEDLRYRRESIDPPSFDQSGSGRDVYESHSYNAFAYWVRHYSVRDAVSLFWEAGPSFRFSEYREESSSLYPSYYGPGEQDFYTRSGVRRGVTLDANVGFEWFFNRRLSLGARYGVYGGYGWGRQNSTRESYALDGSSYELSRSDERIHDVSFQTSAATVSLAAYF